MLVMIKMQKPLELFLLFALLIAQCRSAKPRSNNDSYERPFVSISPNEAPPEPPLKDLEEDVPPINYPFPSRPTTSQLRNRKMQQEQPQQHYVYDDDNDNLDLPKNYENTGLSSSGFNNRYSSSSSISKARATGSNINNLHETADATVMPERLTAENMKLDDDVPEWSTFGSPPRRPKSLLAQYQSTLKGRLSTCASATVVGGLTGALVGQGLFHRPKFLARIFALGFLFTSLVLPIINRTIGNSYGNVFVIWTQSLGLAFILVLQRLSEIRNEEYLKTGQYIRAALGYRPRTVFPPGSNNPWRPAPDVLRGKYSRHFRMLPCVVCMSLVGGTCGGNLSVLPLVPTWIGALAGAVVFGTGTLQRNPRGDLLRVMGARVLALVQLLLQVGLELQIWPKTRAVLSKILDFILVLDRQHRLKEKITAVLTALFNLVSKTANQVQRDMTNSSSREDRNESPPQRRRPPPAAAAAFEGTRPSRPTRTNPGGNDNPTRSNDDGNGDDDLSSARIY